MRFSVIFLLLTFCVVNLFAQTRTIKGVVMDTNDEPVIGANVKLKGTSTGASTDINGNFSMEVPPSAEILQVSYLGMKSAEARIEGDFVKIVMEEDVTGLDEVVVIGYGTARRRDLTGAVASISDKALRDTPVASVAEAMTGRLAGVSVTTPEGSPDAEIRIRVRGGTSISQNNDPLFIVDGMTVSTISDIPPSDIASIDILKDAASTAIYGAQGANGVVLITTKSGREGKVSVTLNSSFGVKKATDFFEVLSPYEYVYYQYEIDQGNTFQNYYGRYQDLELYKADPGTDWQARVFGNTGVQQTYNLGVFGGTKSTTFSVNLSRNDEDYIMINSGYKRNNLNFKVNTKLNDNVSLDFNVRLADETIIGPSVSSGSGANTKLRDAVKYQPTKGLAAFDPSISDDDDQAGIGANSLLNNPVQNIENEYKNQNKFTNTYAGALRWKIIDNLTFNSNMNYIYRKNKTDNVWTNGTSTSKNYGGQPVARIEDRKGYAWKISNTLSYRFNFNKEHNFDMLVGQEASESKTNNQIIEARYFPVDFSATEVLAAMSAGQAEPLRTTIGEPNRMVSFIGRVNYNYKDKYMLTLTGREDGTSVFGPGLFWGFFPGGALAWRASEEAFLESQKGWLDDLKFRLSYGAVGNARVNPYWRQTYVLGTSSVFYPNETPTSIATPSGTLKSNGLTWEATKATNFGIDFVVLNQRLSGTVDIYNNITDDLIVAVPIPSTSGYNQQYQNVAKTSNKGIEIGLNAYLVDTRDFSLSATFNVAFNKNNVMRYPGETKLYGSSWNGSAEPNYDFLIEEGRPLGQMYGYITDGMYTFDDFTWNEERKVWDLKDGVADNSAMISAGNYFGPGALKFKKIADDGTNKITENDRQVIGNALPKHTGGFGFNAAYKGFDAAIFFNWSYGNDIYNANKLDYSAQLLSRKYQNLGGFMSLENRFTTIDPATGNNIYYGNNADPDLLKQVNGGKTIWHPLMTTTALHSWAIEDGSFLRLNNLTIGYTIPGTLSRKWLIESVRIYATGYNLYCWTNYSGPDPEVSTRTNTPFTPGVDYSAYPKAKTFVGGINITF
ncbi:TonB-dependent receptor [Proteiniphilum sp. X52]|uniref:SusC/RagA family TonB-linked outer membrane protein n=1 Tax=Proteiniphilum sp. X52 TaxID=2382159 RepID=UPI0021019013|nr:TonB-dependent receptor [Proteiniphilum sp. X52]